MSPHLHSVYFPSLRVSHLFAHKSTNFAKIIGIFILVFISLICINSLMLEYSIYLVFWFHMGFYVINIAFFTFIKLFARIMVSIDICLYMNIHIKIWFSDIFQGPTSRQILSRIYIPSYVTVIWLNNVFSHGQISTILIYKTLHDFIIW